MSKKRGTDQGARAEAAPDPGVEFSRRLALLEEELLPPGVSVVPAGCIVWEDHELALAPLQARIAWLNERVASLQAQLRSVRAVRTGSTRKRKFH